MTIKRGFTLIELLIVVAIIAILAAIAVPNLLEAQIRSKVSRVKGDMKSYATAIESFAVDNNEHPQLLTFGDGGITDISITPLEECLIPLSTPVAYLSQALIPEPFNSRQGWIMYRGWDVIDNGGPPPDAGQRVCIYTFVGLPSDAIGELGAILLQTLVPSEYASVTIDEYMRVLQRRWYLVSPGPDTFYEFDRILRTNGQVIINAAIGEVVACALEPRPDIVNAGVIYDPTNGSVSRGEIVRTAAGFFLDVK